MANGKRKRGGEPGDGWRERFEQKRIAKGLSYSEINRRIGRGPTYVNKVINSDTDPSIVNMFGYP